MAGFSPTSANQCLAILELLIQDRRELPLKRIADTIGVAASATHRLLGVLMDRGYVSQDAASGFYAPTLLFAALGARVLSATNIVELCQPVLIRLAAESRELARFSVVENGQLIWIAKSQGSQSSIRYDPVDGEIVPLHATAMGKAWLATMPEDEALRLIKARGFQSRLQGPNMIRSLEGLRKDLAKARRSGFGLVEEEAEAGVSAIGVVVRSEALPSRPVIGCLSIGGPATRLDKKRLISFFPALKTGAEELGKIWMHGVYHPAREPKAKARVPDGDR